MCIIHSKTQKVLSIKVRTIIQFQFYTISNPTAISATVWIFESMNMNKVEKITFSCLYYTPVAECGAEP